MKTKNKLELLIPGCTYHVYNRANGNEKLFLSNENYRYFFEKYMIYISPIANTFCYCLMPNHFHFLIKIKSLEEVKIFFKNNATGNGIDYQGFKNLEGLDAGFKKMKTYQNYCLINSATSLMLIPKLLISKTIEREVYLCIF